MEVVIFVVGFALGYVVGYFQFHPERWAELKALFQKKQ